jgi:hypothetical protein
MTGIFAPPPGYSPAKLGAYAALCFALAVATVGASLDLDDGIPDISSMAEAHGRVLNVSPYKYGVKFRLHGRAETFNYPSKAKGYDVVESALVAAGNGTVAVLFNPTPNTPWSGADAYCDVWQLAIDGKSVRTVEESIKGWRSDNVIGRWLFASFFLSGLYLSWLAWRASRS